MIRTDILDAAFAALPASFRLSRPRTALVLGSGWNRAVDSLDTLATCDYGRLPGLGAAAVPGHDGALHLVRLPGGSPEDTALVFCGRRHWYECEAWEPVIFPADFCRRLAIPELVLTNAAGGVNPAYRPGDVVLLLDHIRVNALSPLAGPHNPLYGPRFPDQSHVYHPDTARRLRDAARAAQTPLRDGVYAVRRGPVSEPPAEVRAYALMGADLVGMSTVPEAIVASAIGIRVGAVSLVTNMAAGLNSSDLCHEEVVATARENGARLARILHAYLEGVAAP